MSVRLLHGLLQHHSPVLHHPLRLRQPHTRRGRIRHLQLAPSPSSLPSNGPSSEQWWAILALKIGSTIALCATFFLVDRVGRRMHYLFCLGIAIAGLAAMTLAEFVRELEVG